MRKFVIAVLAFNPAVAVAQTLLPISEAFPVPTANEFGPQAEAPDNLNLADIVEPAQNQHTDGEGAAGGETIGAFRFICDPGHVATDDPIVYPGQRGKSHIHQFYGNLNVRWDTTYSSQRAAGDTTCVGMGNRSSYWMPPIISGMTVQLDSANKVIGYIGGQVIRPDEISIYYKREPKNSVFCTPGNPKYKGICVSIPNALKFIFGYDMLSNTIPTGSISFNCLAPDGTLRVGDRDNISDAANGCQIGDKLNLKIAAPACWDGVNLDSANHRSHTAELQRPPGVDDPLYFFCPSTHPYYMPHFTLQAFYRVDANLNRTGNWTPGQFTWHLSSDIMYGMPIKKPGTTFHTDYFEGWNARIKKAWTDNCIDRFMNCSGGDLGNGYRMKGSHVYTGASPRYVPIPAGARGPFSGHLHGSN